MASKPPPRELIGLLTTGGLALVGGGLALAQPAPSGRSATEAPPPFTAKDNTAPPKASTDMQAVLTALQGLGGKPVEMLAPVDARRQPSPADAVKVVMAKKGLPTAPDASVSTHELAYGADPMQKARIYKPADAGATKGMPVIYFHGGGWVIADLDTYDATPRLLSKQLHAVVVSVEYRHAPEAKFPAQHEDAAAAYAWTLKNAASWGGDVRRLAMAGESAGGNLAVATAIYARDNKLQMPLHILSVYPIANTSTSLPSRIDSGNAKPLNTPMLSWFSHYFSRTPADAHDPRLNLVAANLRGLPPTTIVNAQIDPLRSDGDTLVVAMKAAGVKVEQRTFVGVTHEFFGMGKVVKGALDAETYAIARLKPALSPAK